jgi:DNA-binding NtrC family response regulator
MNPKKQINIFIVEDNRIFAMALKADIETAFANMPITIHSFETGENCMKKFGEIKPQVMILDYNLNSKIPAAADGMQILDWVKKQNAETNVIMLSADDHIEIALKSFKHGACDYVVKSETKFSKINYSLFNLFKMLQAKAEAKRYKRLLNILFISVALFIGGLISLQIFSPQLLRQ